MIDLTVKTKDKQPRTVKVGPADLIKFERQYGVGVTQFNAESLRYEWLAFLAWTSLTREKETSLEFDAWIDTLEELSPEAAEGNEGSDAEASPTSSQP
jgi:hypothetical protein